MCGDQWRKTNVSLFTNMLFIILKYNYPGHVIVCDKDSKDTFHTTLDINFV